MALRWAMPDISPGGGAGLSYGYSTLAGGVGS